LAIEVTEFIGSINEKPVGQESTAHFATNAIQVEPPLACPNAFVNIRVFLVIGGIVSAIHVVEPSA
jgi:hypothetical protein